MLSEMKGDRFRSANTVISPIGHFSGEPGEFRKELLLIEILRANINMHGARRFSRSWITLPRSHPLFRGSMKHVTGDAHTVQLCRPRPSGESGASWLQ